VIEKNRSDKRESSKKSVEDEPTINALPVTAFHVGAVAEAHARQPLTSLQRQTITILVTIAAFLRHSQLVLILLLPLVR